MEVSFSKLYHINNSFTSSKNRHNIYPRRGRTFSLPSIRRYVPTNSYKLLIRSHNKPTYRKYGTAKSLMRLASKDQYQKKKKEKKTNSSFINSSIVRENKIDRYFDQIVVLLFSFSNRLQNDRSIVSYSFPTVPSFEKR